LLLGVPKRCKNAKITGSTRYFLTKQNKE